MDLTSGATVKKLLKDHEIKPFKGLGQNFLINQGVLKKIIEAADITPEDIVLEIGPGIGTLTQELAKKAKKVIAVEKDKKMVEILRQTIKNLKNVEIIQGDILKIKNLKIKNYKVVANLPYNITSPVIRKFLEAGNPPKEMILMVQKEVAQRICAKPPDMTRSTGSGSSRAGRGMNLLAVSVQFYSEPKILFYVSKNNFWPRPKVDGAILRISRIRTNLPRIDTNLFFKIVKAGFSQPRKQIVNNLSKMLKLDKPSQILRNKTWAGKETVKDWLLKNGIQPTQRAETLAIEDWLKVTKTLKFINSKFFKIYIILK